MASNDLVEDSSNYSHDNLDEERLPEMFSRALQMFKEIEDTTEETRSHPVQYKIHKCMKLLEDCTRLVSASAIFSSNESVEELSTESIQYLLLPALLGNLTLKLSDQSRKEVVNISEIYYRDFLQRCVDYGVTSLPIPESKTISEMEKSEDNKPVDQIKMLASMITTREAKIRRFNEQKEMKEKLSNLKLALESPSVDDSTKRDYFMTLIKSYVYQSLDDLNGIENEKPMIEFMEARKKGGNEEDKKPKIPPPPLRPIIITKDAVQKAVFGYGYPSLPVMSIEDFYEQRVKDGSFPAPQTSKGISSLQQTTETDMEAVKEREAEEKENKVESDDLETLERARAMDEYKDDHRRGWGNRHNRS